jgi:hypothetical protein
MIGTQQLEILNSEILLRGMSQSDHISDGGFSPDSEGVNLTVNPGLLHFPDAIDDADTDDILNAATDTIIASSPDDVNFGGSPRRVVNGVGQYVLYDGTKLGAVLQTDSTNTYTRGFCQMTHFDGETFITTRQTLVRWKQGTPTFTISFLDFSAVASLSGLADSFPHPLLNFENHLYTASGNELFRTAVKSIAPTVILTLADDQIITALGIDSGSGKMLIATSTAMTAALTVPSINKLLWYDGFSNKVIKSIGVEDTILALHNHEGITYVGYGLNVGYVTGSGIQFLRRLNVTRSNATLPYQASFASVGRTLCVIERDKILAYGEIVPGIKTWYYIYGDPDVTKDIDHIFDAGSGKLGFSYVDAAGTDAEFSTLDTTSVASSDDSVFVTNWFRFPRPILPKAVLVEFAAGITAANNFVYYQAETDTSHTANELSEDISGSSLVKIMTGFLNERVSALKFRFSQGGGVNTGIRRAILYYDYAE